MALRSLQEKDIKKNDRILLRVDLDVTGVGPGDDIRLGRSADGIRALLEMGARVRVLAHRGRPGGKHVEGLSLAPFLDTLSASVGASIELVSDPFSDEVFAQKDSSPGVLCFENIRFWEGEEKNDPVFARALSRWGDVFVNDAFAASHRRHASISGIAEIVKSFAGAHLAKEVSVLSDLLINPKRPFIAVLGGAKLETKLPLINNLFEHADSVFLGGQLANTALFAQGYSTGESVVERTATEHVLEAILQHDNLIVPSDVVISRALDDASWTAVRQYNEVREDEYIVDVGPETMRQFLNTLKGAGTVVWNGPLGVTEQETFQSSTLLLAKELSNMQGSAFTVVGGGHTLSVLGPSGFLEHVGHVSTGGGAMLALLAGERLPGVDVLQQ